MGYPEQHAHRKYGGELPHATQQHLKSVAADELGGVRDDFVARLEPFLEALPAGFRYAVEIRNPEYLGALYFETLARHNVAHVFNAWTRMPPLGAQIAMPEAFTSDFNVVRALLREGRPYERAVEQFSPYDQVKDENPEGREALRALIRRMREERRAAMIFVNNRFEGNAPATIEAIAG